jgi:hypothetical protein
MAAEICTGVSALQLIATSLSFLLTVILLDAYWVRLPEQLRAGNFARTLRRQSLLNLVVALGATCAAAGQPPAALERPQIQRPKAQLNRRCTVYGSYM